VLDEAADPALVREVVLLLRALVEDRNANAGVEEGELAQPLREAVEVELGDREDLRIRPEGHLRARLLRGADGLDRRRRLAGLVGLLPDLAVAADLDVEPLRERIDDGHADSVQAAGHLVGVVVELTSGVEVRHDDLERLAFVLLVHPDRDAAAVVLDRDGIVGVDRDGHVIRVADLRLVDRVVDELEDHVVEAGDVVGVPDVHAGALPNGLQALQKLDRVGGVCGVAAHLVFDDLTPNP
jgi:hypothetical protein